MLLVKAMHAPEFLTARNLGVEIHITRDDVKDDFAQYIPFVGGIHLPYSGVNLAAFDESTRRAGIDKVKRCIDAALQYHIDTMVMHPCGIFYKDKTEVGKYPLLIDSLRELADFAAGKGVTLALENQVLRHPDMRIIAGCSSADWFQLHKDVARSNVKLTLDTSHAASVAAHGKTTEERRKIMWSFFEHPDLIARFHWSDARLSTDEAVWNDMHLVPGKGDLPRELHQEVLNHPGVKLLEQKCTSEEVQEALDFIAGL